MVDAERLLRAPAREARLPPEDPLALFHEGVAQLILEVVRLLEGERLVLGQRWSGAVGRSGCQEDIDHWRLRSRRTIACMISPALPVICTSACASYGVRERLMMTSAAPACLACTGMYAAG